MRWSNDRVIAGTWINGVDARVKVISIIIFIITVTTLHNKTLLAGAVIFLLATSLLAGIPLVRILIRLTCLIPFGGLVVLTLPLVIPGEPFFSIDLGFLQLVASKEGWESAVLPCLRMVAAFLGMIFLTSTTSIGDLCQALRYLKIPAIFIVLVEFTIRYMAVVQGELVRMQTAGKSRGFKASHDFWHVHTMKTIGNTIAMLFLRSHERAERVYNAMLSRGYDHDVRCIGPCQRVKISDLCWGVALIFVAWAIKIIEFGGYQWNLPLK